MCVYFLFLLSIIGLSASDYHKTVLVPAYETVADWKVAPEVAPLVNGPYKINLFANKSDVIQKKRLTHYSMGLPMLPIPSEKSGDRYPSVAQLFGLIQQHSPVGTYPSDYIVNDVSAAGLKNPEASRLISFGQGADAFRMALVFDELCKKGLEEIDIDGLCFGTQQIVNMLFVLGHPEEYPDAQKFFTAAGIDRIDREKILSMIKTISLNASLKDPADPVIHALKTVAYKPIIRIQGGLIGAFALRLMISGSLSQRSFLGVGASCAGLQALRSTTGLRPISKALFNTYASFCLPSYNSAYPSVQKMLKIMKHYETDYPIACLYMTKKNDSVVGSFGNDEFFINLPMQELMKFLLSSSDSDHVTIDPLQRAAKNAFLEKYGASHYTIPSILKVGHKLLEIAQKNQYKNIGHYITEMEKQDNYNLLFNGNEFGDENVSINELNFSIKKACL